MEKPGSPAHRRGAARMDRRLSENGDTRLAQHAAPETTVSKAYAFSLYNESHFELRALCLAP